MLLCVSLVAGHMRLPERIFAKESVRAMQNKPFPESDGPMKLTFKLLKEITNNFAEPVGYGASAEVYKVSDLLNGVVSQNTLLPYLLISLTRINAMSILCEEAIVQ